MLVMQHPDDEHAPAKNHLLPNPITQWSTRPMTWCAIRVPVADLMSAQHAEETCTPCWNHALGKQNAAESPTPAGKAYEQRKREGRRGQLADEVEAINWGEVPQ
ncbi:hypothetical protein CNX65_24990 [Actinosynnema pretiosum]|uniref:Uncharacterized protein n=2 Tax=Pseudonocardiaceae TaxID=2070 RepID=A0A290ZAV0_9PSEU|nr:hypothetical protein CNX65_24990 [Actinosynnema pretiosum]